MKIYTILLLPTIFSPVCFLYEHFRCPLPSERRFRAKWFCQKYGLKEENYACLYDRILNVYSESCKFQVHKLHPGEKFVIYHTPAGVSCENDRYQPFGLEQFSDECVYRRSMCSVLGQVRFYDGSSIVDKSCRCNFKEEYRFVSMSQKSCFCYPSVEDCSCYLHRCPENYTLTPDYQCIHITNKINIPGCPDMAHKERSATEKNVDKKDFQEIYVVKGLSHGTEILTGLIVMCLLYTVATFYLLQQDKLPSNCYMYISLNPPNNLCTCLENGILTLTWSSPGENMIGVESYKLMYTSTEWVETMYIRVDAMQSSCIIPNLLPMRTYRFKIASCSHEFDGKPSNQCSFEAGRPNSPSELVMTKEKGDIRLMWTSPAGRLFKTDSYHLEVTNEDWESMITVSIPESVLEYVIKDCSTDSTYRCKLYSVSNSVKSLPTQATFVNNILVANQTELTTAEKEEMNDTFIQIVSNYPKQLCRVKENLQRTDYDPSLPVAKKEVPFVWDEDKTTHATKQIIGRENEINSKMFDLQDNKSKESWFYKLIICCDGKMVNIDSCVNKTECSNNMKQLKDITSKDQTELSSHLHSVLGKNEKEFEVLLIFSTLLKTSIIRPDDWLLTVIEHQNRMVCYMLLAYITGTKAEKEDVILPALQMAIEKGAHKITNTISWFIIRKLFKSFLFDIDSLRDIWPAFVCKNMNCQESRFCSKELVIAVDTKQPTGELPIKFWNIEVKYLNRANVIKTKTKSNGQICSDAYPSDAREDLFLEKFEIDGNLASKLFKMHSKLTFICKSLYKSKDSAKIERPCVQLFCRGKGLIPVNENHFPKSINNVETDILEGEPVFAGRLRVGEKINSDHYSGTLGGFVEVFGDILFLTCAHVVVHNDNIRGKSLTFPKKKAVYMNCVQTSQTTPCSPNFPNSEITFRCGKLHYIEFKTDKPGETSIDAALFRLQEDIGIDPEDFVANRMNETRNFQFLGMKSPFLNDNCVDCDKLFSGISFIQFENVTVGAESCFHINHSTIHMAKDIEEGINVDKEPITETYAKIMESENQASSSHFSSAVPIISNNAHLQTTQLKKLEQERTLRRLSRCMYNQIAVTHIPFQPGDSGTCIYVRDKSLNIYGCIGMAIANHPDLDGGVIVTPMKEILKTFHVDMQ